MVAFTIYRLDVCFPAHLLNDTDARTAPKLSTRLFSPIFGEAFALPPARVPSTILRALPTRLCSRHVRLVLAVSLRLGSLFIATLLARSSLHSGRLKRGRPRQR